MEVHLLSLLIIADGKALREKSPAFIGRRYSIAAARET